MDISSAVAHKIGQDEELLDLLRAADPKAQIDRGILLTLNTPEVPTGYVSEEDRAAFTERMSEVATQAAQGFAGIEGLEVYNLMKGIGHASIGGTAEAVAKALELDCVTNGMIGDRPIIRGASDAKEIEEVSKARNVSQLAFWARNALLFGVDSSRQKDKAPGDPDTPCR